MKPIKHGSLMDSRDIQDELGVSYNIAVKIMRQLRPQVIPGVRKSFVRRADLDVFLDANLLRRVG